MTGKGEIKDNWDLSVMRATAIVKIITSNSKTDPTRLTAAGRGEYFPIDNAKTPEARKKNRRTEIILTPKLDELLKVLETN
jgi:chemotaxis protein MotB